jgi:alkylation response protein AidB-like acyl-CoA dehydrogenase
MNDVAFPDLMEILPGIRSRADRLDETGDWPAEDLHMLSTAAAMRWAVPTAYDGEDLSAIELHFRYEAIAAASLTAALILTQRDGAVAIIASSGNETLKEELLPRLARNELFTTAGIAQLTTSRQRGGPALRANIADGKLHLHGEIPWATAAAQSAVVIVGGVLEDGRQILCALPMRTPGVQLEPALPLMALRGGHTSTIRCDNVTIDTRQILLGPAENVLSLRKNVLPIGQTFLAMGLTAGAITLIGEINSDTATAAGTRLGGQLHQLRSEVLDFCNPAFCCDAGRGSILRGQVIDLALRATQTAVSLHKGAGLIAGHPAQRLAREALFLLVWSCPSPVVECTVDILSAERTRPT